MQAKRKQRKKSPIRFVTITVTFVAIMLSYEYLQTENETIRPTFAINDWKTVSTTLQATGLPIGGRRTGGQVITRKGYTLSYDADFKTPQWVTWELTGKETQGEEGRTDRFVPDPDIRGAKAYSNDYTNSGYDRGHMAPAADMKWNRQAMKESFYMSNICPQNSNLNRGNWNDLEELSRRYAERYGAVTIACGPVYDSSRPRRIGTHRVAVPDAFFKVILIGGSQPCALGFLFENRAGHRPLSAYLVTVDSVEHRTGLDFFPALPDDVENRLEAELRQALP